MSAKKKSVTVKSVSQKLAAPLKVAVFAGSFDPFTLGHLDVVRRAASLFDTLWVLVAQNSAKRNMFSSDVRKLLVEIATVDVPNVKVAVFEGLTVDFMKQVGARYLVRGVRNSQDLDFEQAVAWNNKALYEGAETLLLLSAPEHLAISSSVVRELLMNGVKNSATLSKFVPEIIVPDIVR